MRWGRRRLLALVLVLGLALAGCADPGGPGAPDENGTADREPSGETPRTTIAWNRTPAPSEVPEPDKERLWELVDRQVHENATDRPRYRTPGTEGHEETVPILADMLAGPADRVETETFRVELPCLGEVDATNLHGIREGSAEREIWLAAHWDSRAWADHAADESRREEPVLGANDGAAAVAVATHALEILPETNATVRTVLFDAEDQGSSGDRMPCDPSPSSIRPHGGWIKGSTHTAQRLGDDELDRIQALILVDMPGHEELSVKREGRSEARSPDLTDLTFGVAERLEAPSFRNETGGPVLDDHVPFLQRGVRAVDLIHLDDNGSGPFPWTWHTPHDTPAHLSRGSMSEVTRVVVGTAMAVDRGALPPPDG